MAGVGDTVMSLDPISAQGANNGNKMVRKLVECVRARGEQPFDAPWLEATFERFWARHGQATYAFTHSMLGPPGPALRALLFAQYGSDGRFENTRGEQLLANAFAESANDPAALLPVFQQRRRVHAFIEQTTGGSWLRAVARGAMGVAWEELRPWRGLEPRHPRVAEYRVAA